MLPKTCWKITLEKNGNDKEIQNIDVENDDQNIKVTYRSACEMNRRKLLPKRTMKSRCRIWTVSEGSSKESQMKMLSQIL